MPTTSISWKFWTAARNTMRPMRPKPLMPILMVMKGPPEGSSKWSKRNSALQHGKHRGRDILRRKVEVLEQRRRRRRFAVGVDADDRRAAVLPPAGAHAHLDRDARHARRQHRALVLSAL